jgi:hypothetical protein
MMKTLTMIRGFLGYVSVSRSGEGDRNEQYRLGVIELCIPRTNNYSGQIVCPVLSSQNFQPVCVKLVVTPSHVESQ